MSVLSDEVIAFGSAGLVMLLQEARMWVQRRRHTQPLPKIADDVAWVKAQLMTNGGQTLRDKVERISEMMDLTAARWRITVSTHSVGIFESDESGELNFANPSLCHLFGMDEQAMLGRGWLRAIGGPDERLRVWEDWKSSVEKSIPYETAFIVHNQTTGEQAKCRSTAIAHRSRKTGAVLQYYGTIEPVRS